MNRKKLQNLRSLVAEMQILHNEDIKMEVSPNLKIIRVLESNYSITIQHEDGIFSISDKNIPIEFEIDPHSSLSEIVHQFQAQLTALDELFQTLGIIDNSCPVVEPTEPTPKDNWRLLKMSSKVFLKLILNPLDPTGTTFEYIGPNALVEPLREMSLQRMKHWDLDRTAFDNIMDIFEPPSRESIESLQKECSLCFDYRLESGQIPLITCDNERCDTIYHLECLQRWIAEQKKARILFGIAHSVCAFCKMTLATCIVCNVSSPFCLFRSLVIQTHVMFIVLYLIGFFLERKPCTICSVVFLTAVFLICYSGVGNCLFWSNCSETNGCEAS